MEGMEIFAGITRYLVKRVVAWFSGDSVTTEDSDLVNYECQCCFNEVPFDYLVQCDEGHLFCVQCFQRYVHEAVYGQGQQQLVCLAEACDKTFSESQIVRALPDKLRAKFDERIQDEILCCAGLDNLVKCPNCDTGAILDPRDTYFICPKCSQVTCRTCKQLYENHEDNKCREAQDDVETKRRKECEEKMAAVLIRKCPKCNLRFTKKDGCNKIACRCGTKICYVCRMAINGYDHFCRHFRLPGLGCSVCKACNLYTNTDEDDRQAILEIQRAAERLKLGDTCSQGFWSRVVGFFTSFGRQDQRKKLPVPR